MTESVVEQINASVDWLTMTLTESSTQYTSTRFDAHLMLYEIAKEGYVVEQRGLQGYRGLGVAGCFVGVLDDRTLLQFSGHHAHAAFEELYHPDCNVSRLDLQATCKFDVMPKHLAKREYKNAIRANDGLPKSRQRKISIIIGSDGGDTCYIGAASSKQRGIIYNKEVESQDNEFERSWRFEARLRDDICDKWIPAIYHKYDALPSHILAVVAQFFTERGVTASYFGNTIGVSAEPVKSLPSDVNRKLAWLEAQVVPSVNWLCDQGYEYELREMFYRITNDSHYPSCPINERVHIFD